MIPFGYFYFAFWRLKMCKEFPKDKIYQRFTFRDFPELSILELCNNSEMTSLSHMPNEWENTKQALFLLILLFSQLIKL